jgi:hypothetical protein
LTTIEVPMSCAPLHFDAEASAVWLGVYDNPGHQPPHRFDQFGDIRALGFERLDPRHQGGEVDGLRYRVDQALKFA